MGFRGTTSLPSAQAANHLYVECKKSKLHSTHIRVFQPAVWDAAMKDKGKELPSLGMCGDPRDSTRRHFRRQDPLRSQPHKSAMRSSSEGSILCSACPLASVYQGCGSTDFVQSRSFRLEAKYNCTVEATPCPQTPTPKLDGCRDWTRLGG